MSARNRHQPWFESPVTKARRRLSEISRAMRECGTQDGYALWYEYAACLNLVATGGFDELRR